MHDEAAALVAILSFGAVALPLDVTAPAKRLAAILHARGCRALVHDEAATTLVAAIEQELAALGGGALGCVTLDERGQVLASAGDAHAATAMDEDVACVLHTSGSTGMPKPVPMTWAGLDAFTSFCVDVTGLVPSDRVLRVAELTFDLAWFDHLASFRVGATLVTMNRRDLAVGRALRDAFAALRPTVVYGVPSLFMKLNAALAPGERLEPSPRVVLYAGEIFPPRELRAFAARVPDAVLANFFGPTETNVCTYHPIGVEGLDGERETPIGRATPYAHCALVDEAGEVIDGEGIGELVVTGPTVLGGGPYATRDRVERKADGLFYFRGRIDRVVKIRGIRVDPGEVETALALHPCVRQAAVVVVEDAKLGRVLRGHVAAAGHTDERALRMFLAESLPPPMIPDRISLATELPTTPTGKVDYGALGQRER
jgi:acyl-coenzyme A synthetase/AMP-(fatty) acid ligase